MKKTFFCFFVAFIALSVPFFAQSVGSEEVSRTIAVRVPSAVNFGDDAEEKWILPFLQSVITTNFQKYSGLNVLDEQHINDILEMQKRAESGEYSDEGADLRGQLLNAGLTVTGSVVKKSDDFALSFNITDTKTGESRASSVKNCDFEELKSGKAANSISFELMTGFGIALGDDVRAELTGNVIMTREMESQADKAKGIVAAKDGSNFEAMRYYIQSQKKDGRNVDVSERMVNIATVISNSSSFNATGKELIKMRREWDDLLHDFASLLAENQIQLTLVYYTNVQERDDLMSSSDYDNETMPYSVSAPTLEQIVEYNNGKVVEELQKALAKIPQSKNWGDKINGFPWSYADDFGEGNWLKKAVNGETEDFSFMVQLINAETDAIIAQKNVAYRVQYSKNFGDAVITAKGKFADSKKAEWKLVFDGVPLESTETNALSVNVVSADGKNVPVMPADLYEKKTATLAAIQNEQRKAQAEKKRKKEKAELKAANALFYRGSTKSLYLEITDTMKGRLYPVKEEYSIVGTFEIKKWLSIGGDISFLSGKVGHVAWNGGTLEGVDSEKVITYMANLRLDAGYPIWLFYPHAFLGVGGFNLSLDSNSMKGISFETGLGLDLCVKNHFVIGVLMKTINLNKDCYEAYGVNLGWRF